ncbi:unnamed protein product [Caenorhabditis brenneri]
MKHWRFFPLLVKIEVLKNMNLTDKLSFLKCSKKCWNLLSRIPYRLESFIIPHGIRFPVDDFLALITCRRFTIQELEVAINTAEMHKKSMDLCDPAFMESIEIERLDSQEIYEDISKSQRWKNSRVVSLNWKFDSRLKVNISDFLHFKSIRLKMEELSVGDAWKLVQNFVSTGSQDAHIDIRSRILINIDLIRSKIETELVGEWKGTAYNYLRFVRHPKNPQLILKCRWESNNFNAVFITPEQFDFYRLWLLAWGLERVFHNVININLC